MHLSDVVSIGSKWHINQNGPDQNGP